MMEHRKMSTSLKVTGMASLFEAGGIPRTLVQPSGKLGKVEEVCLVTSCVC